MWQNDPEPVASTSTVSAREHVNSKHTSSQNLNRSSSSTSLFKRAISLQFLSRNTDNLVDKEKKAFIKMRYKETSKYVIWPFCKLPDKLPHYTPITMAKPEEADPRTVLHEPDIEDHRSPYLPCTINHVLRSDSEDSSSAEQVLEMTRNIFSCSSTESTSN
ncbi:unnamed protein product [Caenorhabditis bovis]|uniref:Uncharacterized protein n=1 Tax=Caenorhabditis bovis TaxID=2654633 RepID=A0A8S1EPD2_9PELO|nr:unnamed protein product [Caenorhabditis bovis]